MAYVRFAMIKQMGTPAEFPEAWMPLFGRNSTPTDEAEKYPSKVESVGHLCPLATNDDYPRDGTHSRATGWATRGGIFQESPLPTLGDLLLQMLIAHDGLHVGQLSDWRRAMGYSRLM